METTVIKKELNWKKKGNWVISINKDFRFLIFKSSGGFFFLTIYDKERNKKEEYFDTLKEAKQFANNI